MQKIAKHWSWFGIIFISVWSLFVFCALTGLVNLSDEVLISLLVSNAVMAIGLAYSACSAQK